MPAHEIRMHQTVRLVGPVDMVYEVSNKREGKLGELHISQGGVDWWPKDAKVHYHRCTWEQLRDVLEERPVRRKA